MAEMNKKDTTSYMQYVIQLTSKISSSNIQWYVGSHRTSSTGKVEIRVSVLLITSGTHQLT